MVNCLAEIIECVPNYSIGNNTEVLKAIVKPFQEEDNIILMGVESDDDYNRTVVSLLGEPTAIIEAIIKSFHCVSEHIDLRNHQGEHPFIGAIDVIPLIPIANINIDKCVEYAKILAQRVLSEVGVSSYLYSYAASAANRVKLPEIRKGGFNNLKYKIQQKEWQLDYGDFLNEKLGVSVIGSRPILVAYNIDINTQDKNITDIISKGIRESSGGLKAIQAQSAKYQGIYQVSINIIDYNITSLWEVYQKVIKLASELQVEVIGCEIIGLVKCEIFKEIVDNYLELSFDQLISELENKIKLRDFSANKFLEYHYKFGKI
ncbi:MAG: glutamate formimidoyltransferase [Erysipelotrichaceae bacterium]